MQFVPGPPSQRKRRYHARDQTTDPTPVGMLQMVQAGAVRYSDRSAHPEGAHADGRGDRDPALRVCHVDIRPGALRRTPNSTPQAPPTGHWHPAPITHRPPHVVRQGPREGNNTRASRRPPVNGVSSLLGPYSGQRLGGYHTW